MERIHKQKGGKGRSFLGLSRQWHPVRILMNREKTIFLLLAILAVLSISMIGVAIAERSIIIACIAVLGTYLSFALARKTREKWSASSDEQ